MTMTKRHLIIAAAALLAASVSGFSQDREVIAGIPVNYDESKVGDYKASLPDPLTLNNGKKVTTARQWEKKRRPEILRMFEEYEYGKWPAKKPALRYDVQEDMGFGGEAVRKQYTVYFSKDDNGPRVDVLVYLPKDADGPVPLLLNLSFSPNSSAVSDPGVKPGRMWDQQTRTMREMPQMPARPGGGAFRFGMDDTIKKFLAEGFGFATLCYTDIDPDFNNGATLGVRGLYLKDGAEQPAADEWGSISAWAWGVSNVIDCFEKDPDIDATRVALTGCSRLGKTTIWTGAIERRIAVVMPSCSGEGGAALSRRNFGETIAHLVEPTRFPYQFCANYAQWGPDPSKMPMDAHMLIALIAPRPLLLQTGTTDNWSDAKGEWLAAVEAGPVYELLGAKSLGTDVFPPADTPIYNTLGYVMHEGGHGVMPQDWDYYLEFMKRYL